MRFDRYMSQQPVLGGESLLVNEFLLKYIGAKSNMSRMDSRKMFIDFLFYKSCVFAIVFVVLKMLKTLTVHL